MDKDIDIVNLIVFTSIFSDIKMLKLRLNTIINIKKGKPLIV